MDKGISAWAGKLQRGAGWTALIFAFVFLFFWQMTSVVMPSVRGGNPTGAAGPFADSPLAQALTIASLLIAAGAGAGFVCATIARIWIALVRKPEAGPGDRTAGNATASGSQQG